jgi:hypothetical protein
MWEGKEGAYEEEGNDEFIQMALSRYQQDQANDTGSRGDKLHR